MTYDKIYNFPVWKLVTIDSEGKKVYNTYVREDQAISQMNYWLSKGTPAYVTGPFEDYFPY